MLDQSIMMEAPLLSRPEPPVGTGREFGWARWARLCMAFGATVNAGFSTLGLGLTVGWLACGPAQNICTHHPTERFEQLIPPALGIGLLQGVVFRRVTGTHGDEMGHEKAIALYMPVNVSPRQAFQSLFAVALGWVGLAFPVFLYVASDSWVNPKLPKLPNFNPYVLTANWVYVITVLWAVVLVGGLWGWVNAPRTTAVEPLVVLPKNLLTRAASVVSFAALAMFGYSTGLATLCAANSVALAGTNAWETRLGYPDVGCAGEFNGQLNAQNIFTPGSDGNFYSATAYWLWVVGWISWIVLTVIGIIIQVALLYRRASAESKLGQTLGDQKRRLTRATRTVIEDPARLGGLPRARSLSEPEEFQSRSGVTRSPPRGSPGGSSTEDRAGIIVTKLIMGVMSFGVLSAVFCSLGFMVGGDGLYNIDYRIWGMLAAGSACLTSALAVAAAAGVQGPAPSSTSVDGWRSLNRPDSAHSAAVATYKLFVCDRAFTWGLTAAGTVTAGIIAVTVMTTASQMQTARVMYQDTLGLNPYSTGTLHYVILVGVLLSGIFALMFDTAQTEPTSRQRNAAPLTFFITLSILLCVGTSLSVSSSLSIFVTMVSTLAVVNGLCYSLAIHRSTLPSRRYTALTVVLVLCGSCWVLYLSASTLATVIPPWGCPTMSRPALAAGPPWGCIDLTATVNPTTVYDQIMPPLVTLITMFLLVLGMIAGGHRSEPPSMDRWMRKADTMFIYPATVLPAYGQPLFFLVLCRVLFFAFSINVLAELYNLKHCTVVDMWEWTTCGPPHDIAIDLLGTASTVGFCVTFFNFFEVCHNGVMDGKVQPVDERILDRWLLRPWATGRRTKALREFVLLRAAMMGICTTLYCGLPVLIVLVLIGPEKQLPFGPSGISWLGIVPRFYGFGWWDGRMSRWTFIWVKSAFAATVALVCVVVGYAAGTSRVLLRDIAARTHRLEKATMAELLPHPVHLVSSTLFVCGCVVGSVGAACLNDTLVGTTCTYTQSVILLSVGWPAVGVAVLLEMALPHIPLLLESWNVAMSARLDDVAAGSVSLDSRDRLPVNSHNDRTPEPEPEPEPEPGNPYPISKKVTFTGSALGSGSDGDDDSGRSRGNAGSGASSKGSLSLTPSVRQPTLLPPPAATGIEPRQLREALPTLDQGFHTTLSRATALRARLATAPMSPG